MGGEFYKNCVRIAKARATRTGACCCLPPAAAQRRAVCSRARVPVRTQCVTYSQARGIFGFTGESSIGQVGFPAVQVRGARCKRFVCAWSLRSAAMR